MDSEEFNHYVELKKTYTKRLHILELKAAQQGINTAPEVLMEIDDLRDKVAEIEVLLSDISITLDARHSTNDTEPRKQVEIVFRGTYKEVSAELQKAAIRALAAVLEIPSDEIRVVNVRLGSIIFRLDLPAQAADKLQELYNSGNSELREMGIYDVSIIEPVPVYQATRRDQTIFDIFEQRMNSGSGNRQDGILERLERWLDSLGISSVSRRSGGIVVDLISSNNLRYRLYIFEVYDAIIFETVIFQGLTGGEEQLNQFAQVLTELKRMTFSSQIYIVEMGKGKMSVILRMSESARFIDANRLADTLNLFEGFISILLPVIKELYEHSGLEETGTGSGSLLYELIRKSGQ